mgnify:CR=1 FL=1
MVEIEFLEELILFPFGMLSIWLRTGVECTKHVRFHYLRTE